MAFLKLTWQVLANKHSFQIRIYFIVPLWDLVIKYFAERTFFNKHVFLLLQIIDIKTCQNSGVKVLLSLGGAAGSYGFSSDSEGQTFAETIWNLFGGGTSDTRPFDDAVIDGIDLDIEGGLSTGYAAFVTALRSKGQFLIGAALSVPSQMPSLDLLSMQLGWISSMFNSTIISVLLPQALPLTLMSGMIGPRTNHPIRTSR